MLASTPLSPTHYLEENAAAFESRAPVRSLGQLNRSRKTPLGKQSHICYA